MKGFCVQSNSDKWTVSHPVTCSKVYPLNLADMDIPLYPAFRKSLSQRMEKSNNFTYKLRSQSYYLAIKEWYLSEYSCRIQQQDLVQCPSISHLYAACLLAFTDVEDEVVIITPVYDFYTKSAKVLKRRILQSRLLVKQGEAGTRRLWIDFEGLEKVIENSTKCKMIIFCNPHNPVGRVWNKQECHQIVRIAQKYGLYIFSDEIMCDLRHDHISEPFYTLARHQYKKIIVGNSISKAFNCSSIQGGYGIIRQQTTRDQYSNISGKGLKLLTNQPAMFLTEIVYSQDGKTWLKEIRKLIRTNFQKILKFKQMHMPKLIVMDLDAAYLVMIDFKHYCNSFIELKSRLQSNGIYLNHMTNYFQPPFQTTMTRISISVDPDFFDEFLNVLRKAVTNQTKL